MHVYAVHISNTLSGISEVIIVSRDYIGGHCITHTLPQRAKDSILRDHSWSVFLLREANIRREAICLWNIQCKVRRECLRIDDYIFNINKPPLVWGFINRGDFFRIWYSPYAFWIKIIFNIPYRLNKNFVNLSTLNFIVYFYCSLLSNSQLILIHIVSCTL